MAAGGAQGDDRKRDHGQVDADDDGDFGEGMAIETFGTASLHPGKTVPYAPQAQASMARRMKLAIADEIRNMPGNKEMTMHRYEGQPPFIRPMVTVEKQMKFGRDETRTQLFNKVKIEDIPSELNAADPKAGAMTKLIGMDENVYTMIHKTMISLDVTQTPK
eukprot:gene891-1305_t